MGVNCCTEGDLYRDTEKEMKVPSIGKKGKNKPVEIDDMTDDETARPSSPNKKEHKVEPDKDYKLVEFGHHGSAPAETIVEKTRVVKQGKKVRKYNYKTIEISEEDLTYTLSKIRDVIEQVGEFNYGDLVSEDKSKKSKKIPESLSPSKTTVLDLNTPREMYDT